MDWDGLIGGLLSSPLVVLMLAVIGKLWPDTVNTFATWLYSHVDPLKLPYGSPMNEHWAQARRLDDRQQEIWKDVIKNTIVSLMGDRDSDHSEAIRYELAKLEDLDAHCWVVDAAKEYIIAHQIKTPASEQ